jgi:hypothetical protein
VSAYPWCRWCRPACAGERLGLAPGERAVLTVGGSRGVGCLHAAALTVAAVPGIRPIVVSARRGLQTVAVR